MKTTEITEQDPRTTAYALVRVLFNGNSPAAFNNFFADLCAQMGQTVKLHDVAEQCFEEIARMDAERVKARLIHRFCDLMND